VTSPSTDRPLRIVYLGNNRLGLEVLSWLRERGEEIAGLVIHPRARQKFAERMLAVAALPPERVFDGSQLRRPEIRARVRDLRPDLGLSVLFGYVLDRSFLELFPRGVLNLHPALLPYNRGAYPNVWSIVERTPAGVTLHHVDEGLDTGDIVAQQPVEVEPVDTGQTLYHKLERAAVELFRRTWPRIEAGTLARRPQRRDEGTHHGTGDVERIDRIDLDRTYTARDLIDILRARTFPPHRGAYFESGGRRVFLRLDLTYDE
jgi:methionyl-tRNA formyltransferase